MKRREFLRGSAILSVGVVFGPGCASLPDSIDDGKWTANGWIQVFADERIVFFNDRAEMGQGVFTSQTMMVAEELGVPLDSIDVEFAPVGEAYRVPGGFGQNTGASNSTKAFFVPLRQGAAAVREALHRAAAKRLRVAVAEIVQSGEKGRLFGARGGKVQITMGDLLDDARGLMRAKGTPRASSAWRVLGKSPVRLDAEAKTFGEAKFGIDTQLPGMRYASVWRGLRPTEKDKVHARLAKELGDELDVVLIDAGVALVGENTWEPMAALRNAQSSSWGQAILRSGTWTTQSLQDELSQAVVKGKGARARDVGDVTSAKGEILFASRFSFPYLPHETMEPMNSTAHVFVKDGRPEGAEIWVPTQSLDAAQSAAASLLDLAPNRVKANMTFMGGGFGRRGGVDFVVDAVELSWKLKAPVKVTWSREDDMRFGQFRPGMEHELVLKSDGEKITSWHHRIAGASILAAQLPNLMSATSKTQGAIAEMVTDVLFDNHWVPDPIAVECAHEVTYDIANIRVEHVQCDPGVPVTFWRANGAGFNAFVLEVGINEAARKLKRDPVVFRRELLAEHPREKRVLEAAAEMSGWGTRQLPAGRALGVAVQMSYSTYVAHVAEVSVEGNTPRVHRVWVAVDCGQVLNPDGVRQQMEGGVIYGLSAALHQKLDWEGGCPVQSNFHDVPIVRMHESPEIEVQIIPSDLPPTGVGEACVPPIAPAVANGLRALGYGPFSSLPLVIRS